MRCSVNGEVPQVVPGARVKLAADWGKLRSGDELIVSRVDGPGLVVSPLEGKEELWIPASSLAPNSSVSRAWAFRPRKLDTVGSVGSVGEHGEFGEQLDSEEKPGGFGLVARDVESRCNAAAEGSPPAILTIPCSIRTPAGGLARLTVEARYSDAACILWTRECENHTKTSIGGGGRYRLGRTAGLLSLEIAACRPSDSGIYHCFVESEHGSCGAKIALRVIGRSGCGLSRVLDTAVNGNEDGDDSTRVDQAEQDKQTRQQHVQELKGEGEEDTAMVLLQEQDEHKQSKHLEHSKYTTEERRNESAACRASSEFETEAVGWEAEQFVSRYLELEELGRGRFATVRRARDRVTGQEVALKQTSRRIQSRELTRAEYDFLRSTHHGNIVRAFALFENAPQTGIDTIVLELVKGSSMFAYLSESKEYTEACAAKYAAQLMSGLRWLHHRGRAHLDLKPENVLVDRETGLAKLIDLGEAVRAAPIDEVVPPADLEFAAPELVLGRPTGPYTDMWAAGVFIYVLLSGLSPFLDDSIEETTANILKCDFCFPEEYFLGISNAAKDLLRRLLSLRGEERPSAEHSLLSPWFQILAGATIPSSRMAAFIERRAHRSKSRQDRNGALFPS